MHGKYLYIIDGHNLIPKTSGLSLKMEDDEMELVKRLQIFARIKRAAIEVFFDQGQPGYNGLKQFGMVKAHFVRKGITADREIINRIQKLQKNAGAVTVVTSDHQILVEARALKFKSIRSEDFARLVDQVIFDDQKQDVLGFNTLSDDELDEWMKLFGGKE